MWQGLTIALREGIEMFLIVALILSYLKRTGRHALARAVYAAVAVSAATCYGAFLLFRQASNQALWEGILAIVAAAFVVSLLLYMKRVSAHLKKDIETRIEVRTRAASPSRAFWGVFALTLLMITREGMETALMISTALFQIRSAAVGPEDFRRFADRFRSRQNPGLRQLVDAIEQQLHDEDREKDRKDVQEGPQVNGASEASPSQTDGHSRGKPQGKPQHRALDDLPSRDRADDVAQLALVQAQALGRGRALARCMTGHGVIGLGMVLERSGAGKPRKRTGEAVPEWYGGLAESQNREAPHRA